MKTLPAYLLLGLVALTLTGCPNPCVDELPIYNFQVTASFSPGRDSIQVGDTLFLVSEFPKKLLPDVALDPASELVDYSNATISSSLSVLSLDPATPSGKDAVPDFDYVSEAGNIYNSRNIPSPDGFQQLTFQELSNTYKLKVGLIPKKKGVYGLVIISTASKGRSGGNGCDKATFNVTVANADIHYHYLQEFNGATQSQQPLNGYYFKVY